jgi:hypothetical protein
MGETHPCGRAARESSDPPGQVSEREPLARRADFSRTSLAGGCPGRCKQRGDETQPRVGLRERRDGQWPRSSRRFRQGRAPLRTRCEWPSRLRHGLLTPDFPAWKSERPGVARGAWPLSFLAWLAGLEVMTPGFQSGERGAIPLQVTALCLPSPLCGRGPGVRGCHRSRKAT